MIARAAVLLLLAGGCGAEPAPRPERPPPPSAPGEVVVEPLEGATAMEPTCDPALTERCNALDENCDGIADEGCDYGGGSRLEVTAAWNSDADIDLVMELPSGLVLDGEGGEGLARIDHDGAGACRPGPHPRIARASQPGGRPVWGPYLVSLRYREGCAEEPPPTTATVSLSVDAQMLGLWNVALEPGRTTRIVRFTYPTW